MKLTINDIKLIKKFFLYILVIFTIISFTSCGGCLDWWNPDTSKAITESRQLEELQIHTKLLERQTIALESIAKSLKKLETK